MGGILLHLRTPVLRQLLARPVLAVTGASPIRLHSGTWPILVGAGTVMPIRPAVLETRPNQLVVLQQWRVNPFLGLAWAGDPRPVTFGDIDGHFRAKVQYSDDGVADSGAAAHICRFCFHIARSGLGRLRGGSRPEEGRAGYKTCGED